MRESAPSPQLGQGGWTPETLLAHFTSSLSAVDQRLNELAKADPTTNVIAMFEVHKEHAAELREADAGCRKEIDHERAERFKERDSFREKLATAESSRVDANALAEQRRVDALLQAAQNALALANTRTELTAAALAERVDTSAKTLAASVVASAEALRLQQDTNTNSITAQINTLRASTESRITLLEQTKYQTGGRDEAREPQMDKLIATVAQLAALQQGGAGKSAGISATVAAIIVAVGLLGSLLGIYGIVRGGAP